MRTGRRGRGFGAELQVVGVVDAVDASSGCADAGTGSDEGSGAVAASGAADSEDALGVVFAVSDAGLASVAPFADACFAR